MADMQNPKENSQEQNNDPLLYGNLYKQMFRLSVPTMGGFLFQALYDMVDIFWMGYISQGAVASMTLFSTFFWVVEVFNEIVGASSVSLLSQYHGAGNKGKTQLVAEQTLLFKFLLSLGGMLFMIVFLKPVFNLFTSDPEVIRCGLNYGYIRALFIPIFFSSYSVNTIFRCTGDAKTPMKLLTIAAVLNIILDPIMMFSTIPFVNLPGLGLGMKGAAWATVISISFSFVLAFGLLLAGKAPIRIKFSNLFKVDKEIDTSLFTIGLPNGLNLCMRNIFSVILMKIIASYGTGAVATFGITTRLYSLGMMPQVGFATGSGIIIGHSLGAGMEKRAQDCAKASNRLCTLLCGFVSLFFIIFPKWFLSLFLGGNEPDVSGILLLILTGVSLIESSMYCGYSSAFSGSGLNKPILYSASIAQYLFMLPYAFLIILLKKPVTMLWFVYAIGDTVNLLLLRYYYKQNKWLKHRVFIP